ncbi:MAG: DUF4349 domain-containing protein [Solirubrobacteraceae bacterium]
MRQPDDFQLDPEILAELEAIDATLAGEPVDPRFAEVAELALLVSIERPAPRPEFSVDLDRRVQDRFPRERRVPGESGPGTRSASGGGRRGAGGGRWSRGLRFASFPAAGAIAGGLAAAAVAVVIVLNSGSGTVSQDIGVASPQHLRAVKAPSVQSAPAGSGTSTASASSTAASTTPSLTSAPLPSGSSVLGAKSVHGAPSSPTSTGTGSGAYRTASSGGSSSSSANAPVLATASSPPNFGALSTAGVQPQSNGRRQIQSAQLALMVAPARIDTVAQEAFRVIGDNHGIVNHSVVTAAGGSGGYADIRISVPNQNLAQTMTQLSSLQYATVASRTDMSQDVNDRYLVDTRRLADDKALRTSLLKQLAGATTQTQIDSLKAQIQNVEAAISSDETTLASLNKQISLSQIELTINSGAGPIPVPGSGSGSSGFTLHKALHDAGRVLVVAAGVALIALAVLVPIGLVAALVAWVVMVMRRRGRESALDAAG